MLVGSMQLTIVMLVSIDRYFCIVRPMSPHKLTREKARLALLLTFLVNLLICVAPIFGWNRYVPEGNCLFFWLKWKLVGLRKTGQALNTVKSRISGFQGTGSNFPLLA